MTGTRRRLICALLTAGALMGTTAASATTQPRAPAAGEILIARGGNLYLVNADGIGEIQITRGGSISGASLSRDGQRIAFHKGPVGRRDLFVMNADGTGLTNLTNSPNLDEANPAFSPYGRKVVYERPKSATDRGGIAVMDAAAGAAQRIIRRHPVADPDTREWYANPDWSPTGAQIAVEHWWWYDHSCGWTTLISPTGAPLRELYVGVQPQFDPTGRWLAGWAYFYDDPNHGFKFNLATGTEEIKIPKRPDKDARNLTWSPDGRHLAMMYDGDGDSVFDVCLMNADGTGVAVLQKGADSTTTVRGWRG